MDMSAAQVRQNHAFMHGQGGFVNNALNMTGRPPTPTRTPVGMLPPAAPGTISPRSGPFQSPFHMRTRAPSPTVRPVVRHPSPTVRTQSPAGTRRPTPTQPSARRQPSPSARAPTRTAVSSQPPTAPWAVGVPLAQGRPDLPPRYTSPRPTSRSPNSPPTALPRNPPARSPSALDSPTKNPRDVVNLEALQKAGYVLSQEAARTAPLAGAVPLGDGSVHLRQVLGRGPSPARGSSPVNSPTNESGSGTLSFRSSSSVRSTSPPSTKPKTVGPAGSPSSPNEGSPRRKLAHTSVPANMIPELAHYKNTVQDLKHAIQAHASSMGVSVSSIMDRCVTEDNLSSDILLLQETRMQVMRDRSRAKTAESALYSFQTKISLVLDEVRCQHAELMRVLNDKSASKLGEIQQALNRTHSHVSALKRLLPRDVCKNKKEWNTMQKVNGEEWGKMEPRSTFAGDTILDGDPSKRLDVPRAMPWGQPARQGRERQSIVAKQTQKASWNHGQRHDYIPCTPLESISEAAPVMASNSVVPVDTASEQQANAQSRFVHSGKNQKVSSERQDSRTPQDRVLNTANLSPQDVYPDFHRASPKTIASPRESLGLLLKEQNLGGKSLPCVKFVTPDSPADRAGVQQGNVLVSIERQDVQGLPLSLVCNVLASLDSSSVTLGISDCSEEQGTLVNGREVTLKLEARGSAARQLSMKGVADSMQTTLPYYAGSPSKTGATYHIPGDADSLSPTRAAALKSGRVTAARAAASGFDSSYLSGESFAGALNSPQSLNFMSPDRGEMKWDRDLHRASPNHWLGTNPISGSWEGRTGSPSPSGWNAKNEAMM